MHPRVKESAFTARTSTAKLVLLPNLPCPNNTVKLSVASIAITLNWLVIWTSIISWETKTIKIQCNTNYNKKSFSLETNIFCSNHTMYSCSLSLVINMLMMYDITIEDASDLHDDAMMRWSYVLTHLKLVFKLISVCHLN